MTCGNCWKYGWELQLLYCSKTVKLEIFGIIVIKVLIIVEILWVIFSLLSQCLWSTETSLWKIPNWPRISQKE